MNPKTKRNPQDFVMALLYANQVKKYLESRNIEVEGGFATRQALLGWMLDNPWVYAFLLQNEISRLDTSTGTVSKLEAQIENAFSNVVAKLNLKENVEVEMRAAMAAALQKITEEKIFEQYEVLSRSLIESRQRVQELEDEVSRLQAELANRNNRADNPGSAVYIQPDTPRPKPA